MIDDLYGWNDLSDDTAVVELQPHALVTRWRRPGARQCNSAVGGGHAGV